MPYVDIIQNLIDEITTLAEDHGEVLNVADTFEDKRSNLSCIIAVEGTERFGVVGINVEEYSSTDHPLCFFIFNGKLYDYCKAEGFSRNQMVEDESFENKVLVPKTREEFIDFIIGNN